MLTPLNTQGGERLSLQISPLQYTSLFSTSNFQIALKFLLIVRSKLGLWMEDLNDIPILGITRKTSSNYMYEKLHY